MNTQNIIYCLNCKEPLGTAIVSKWGEFRPGTRLDKHFCDKACIAAYHRHNDAPNIHAKLERYIHFDCEMCGEIVRINEYADRFGQRKPMYCSGACRQKAYRERKKKEKLAQKPGRDREIRNGSAWVCQTPDCGQRRFTEPMGDKCDYCGQSDWIVSRSAADVSNKSDEA